MSDNLPVPHDGVPDEPHPAERGEPVGMERVGGELVVVDGDEVVIKSDNMKMLDLEEYA